MKKNKKRKIFRYYLYESLALEEFLEEMSEKGWGLTSIRGYIFTFKRIEPKKIKYSVNIIDKISIFDGDNCEIALESKTRCENMGWKYICRSGKVQVFYGDDYENSMQRYVDSEKGFENIYKVSLKENIVLLFAIVMWCFNIYMQTYGSGIGDILSSNIAIMSKVLMTLLVIVLFVDAVFFARWYLNNMRRIKTKDSIQYHTYKQLKFKNKIINALFSTVLLVTVGLLMIEKDKFVVVYILYLCGICLLGVIAKRYMDKKGYYKSTNIALYIGGFIIFLVLSIGMVSWNLFGNSDRTTKEIYDESVILSLNDFIGGDDEVDIYSYLNNSVIARKEYYSVWSENEGKHLGYDYFESNYEWAVKLYKRGVIREQKKFVDKYSNNGHRYEYLKLIFEDDSINNGIQVYFDNNNEYLMVSEDKVIQISNNFEHIREEEFLKIVYQKVFSSR